MTVPNPKQQKSARETLADIFASPDNVYVVHYSCESFYDRTDGNSPRITSIALRNLETAQTVSFSIHQVAEIDGVPLEAIEEHYDELEERMLKRFFCHIRRFQDRRYLHWNMRDVNYGFQAIEHRFRVLTGGRESPYEVEDRHKVDLSRLLIDIYGSNYTGHPRLPSLITRGGTKELPPQFLTGEDEAKAFETHDYIALHQSTLRKVHVFANIASLAHRNKLKTNTNWWQMRSGNLLVVLDWITNHPVFSSIVGLLTAAGVIIALVAIF